MWNSSFKNLDWFLEEMIQWRLPDHLTDEDGALLEPLAVAVHSCRKARVGPQSRVLITGSGPIGLVSLLVAKALGAGHVCLTDINESRIESARRLGADSTVSVAGLCPEEAAAAVVAAAGGAPTAAIECSGVDSSLLTAIHPFERDADASRKLGVRVGFVAPRRDAVRAAENGCIIATVGRGSIEPSLPVTLIVTKELEIRGIFRYANCYEAALQLVASGAVRAEQLVSHRYHLEEVEEAFQAARSGEPVKVMIQVGTRQ